MKNNKLYKTGDVVVSKEGENLGQYIEDKNAFISKGLENLKTSLQSMGHYAEARHKENDSIFNIYAKRKIFNEKIGSIEQYLVNEGESVVWRELLDSDYAFVDLE